MFLTETVSGLPFLSVSVGTVMFQLDKSKAVAGRGPETAPAPPVVAHAPQSIKAAADAPQDNFANIDVIVIPFMIIMLIRLRQRFELV